MPTFTTSGATIYKAGVNAAASITGHWQIDNWIDDVEHYICLLCRTDFISAWGTMDANKKYVLREAVENLAAIYCIQYDMSGYTSRVEAEDMINILWARFQDCVMLLKDQKSVTDVLS